MLQNPANFIETFAQNGADRLIFHYESSDKMDWLIEKTKNIGVEVGIALRPETEIDSVNSYLSSIDTVLLMAIQPGIPKHPILPNTFERLEKLRTIRDLHSSRVRIGIDGGVTFDNLLRLASLGADYFVCGSGTIFSPNGSLTENLTILNRLVSKEITH
jgi:ribulose-phosphate 3-epimerase